LVAKPLAAQTAEAFTTEAKGDGPNKPLTFELKRVDGSHPYLEARGITKETATIFGVGFFPGKGLMSGRIVIPIHNAHGELVTYAGRALDDNADPRYRLPASFNKTLELYNLHRALACDHSIGVVIVEGFFDAMNVHQAGFPAVVSLMGWSLSEAQAGLIVAHFDRAILMLDADAAGQEATPRTAVRLARSLDVRIADVPNGSQPDVLSSNEIKQILERHVKN
jgi:DNA primase catalytic core